jgi:hypothetical protein
MYDDYYWDGGQANYTWLAYALLFGFVFVCALGGLFVGAQATKNTYQNWCVETPVPAIDADIRVDGATVEYRVSPEHSSVVINGTPTYSSGELNFVDGIYNLEAAAQVVHQTPWLAALVGLPQETCTRSNVVTRQFIVDTHGPSLTNVGTTLLGNGMILVSGNLYDLSGVETVQLQGYDPVQPTAADRFEIQVPVHGLPGNLLTITAVDKSDNRTETAPIGIPLPPNRWERRDPKGNVTGIALLQPEIPTLGWGLSEWVLVSNGLPTQQRLWTPIWVYGLAIILTSGLFAFVVYAVIDFRRTATQRRRDFVIRAASQAFVRLSRAEWLNVLTVSPSQGDRETWRLNRQEVARAVEDFKYCWMIGNWRSNRQILQWKERLSLIGFWFPVYERAMDAAYRRRDLSEAWRTVNELPIDRVPQFQMLWLGIEEKWLRYLSPFFNPNEVSDHIFDAVGITVPEYLLKTLLYCHTQGSEIPEEAMALMRQLREQLIASVEKIVTWGPEWEAMLIPQIDVVTGFEMEGFYSYLVALAQSRSFATQNRRSV